MRRVLRDRDETGLNLIEVIVALALLAMVMLGVSTLFVRGGSSVKSGRELTQATSIGTQIMEEIDKLSYLQVYTNFGATGSSTSYTACTAVNAAGGCATANSYAQRWQPQIDSMLSAPGYKAFGTIVLTPLGGTAAPPTFSSAQSIRVAVTVQWREGSSRVRSANFETVRF